MYARRAQRYAAPAGDGGGVLYYDPVNDFGQSTIAACGWIDHRGNSYPITNVTREGVTAMAGTTSSGTQLYATKPHTTSLPPQFEISALYDHSGYWSSSQITTGIGLFNADLNEGYVLSIKPTLLALDKLPGPASDPSLGTRLASTSLTGNQADLWLVMALKFDTADGAYGSVVCELWEFEDPPAEYFPENLGAPSYTFSYNFTAALPALPEMYARTFRRDSLTTWVKSPRIRAL